jgi:hypothetical protein
MIAPYALHQMSIRESRHSQALSQQPTMMSTPAAASDETGELVANRYQIKRILDADDQGVQRFLRESDMIAQLSHQNIRAGAKA